eukprot:4364202-Prorocentrum_lima.AAC.1
MTSSLVGSEMCIRDRPMPVHIAARLGALVAFGNVHIAYCKVSVSNALILPCTDVSLPLIE